MICHYTEETIFDLVNRQVGNFWPVKIEDTQLLSLHQALRRLDENFQARNSSVFFGGEGEGRFDVLHSVQYMVFLWTYANQLYRDGKADSATAVYYLNKVMHANDWFYAVELPPHFSAEHPLGSVMGRAQYGDYLFFYQNTTVGGNRDKAGNLSYPKLGHHVTLYSGAKILGNTTVGNYVIFGADAYAINETIPDNCIVFGKSPNLTIVQKDSEYIAERIAHLWREA